MNDGWRVIMTVVMVCLLLGAVAIGVGFVTGGSMDRIETGLETHQAALKYHPEIRINTDKRIREINLGPWEGVPFGNR